MIDAVRLDHCNCFFQSKCFCNRILEVLKLKGPAVQSSGKAWRAVGLVNRSVSPVVRFRTTRGRYYGYFHGAFRGRFRSHCAGLLVNRA